MRAYMKRGIYMLELKDISLYKTEIFIDQYIKDHIYIDEIVNELITIGITNFQQLEDYINNCTNKEEKEELSFILKNVEQRKERYNKKGKKFQIYSLPIHEDIKLIKNDLINKCSGLILANPMIERPCEYVDFNKESIDFAKHSISHVNLLGKNAICNIPKMGNSYLDKIYSAIQLYDEQVLRQYKENKDNNEENIFMINQKEKRKIILRQYRGIVNYLLDNSNEHSFVWGNITPSQQILLEQTLKSKRQEALRRKENLVNIITNYTTLTELQEGIIKTKTIDRFIVK